MESLSAQQGYEMLPKSISSKHICLCINETAMSFEINDTVVHHNLMSVPLWKMFQNKSSTHDKSVLHHVHTWTEYGFPSGMAFLPAKGNSLYVVFHGTRDHGNNHIMLKYPISPREEEHVKLGPWAGTRIMKSRLNHLHPIVVEIKGLIYVLSQSKTWIKEFETHQNSWLECIAFQVYDPVQDKWTALKAPPFMYYRTDIPFGSTLRHVVLGDKFYVSTCCVSSVFCTQTQEWGPCKLFRFDEIMWPDDLYCYCLYEKMCMGRPFPDGSSNLLVVYEDFLVCATLGSSRDVVAYKVSRDGIVGPKQTLLMGFDDDDDDELEKECGGYLIDLGDGYICLMVTKYHYQYDYGIVPTIKFLLKVSKSRDGQALIREDFLVSSTLALEKERSEKAFGISSFFAY
ncbi:hypothetical protein OROMI_000050 [Orobanche minor]